MMKRKKKSLSPTIHHHLHRVREVPGAGVEVEGQLLEAEALGEGAQAEVHVVGRRPERAEDLGRALEPLIAPLGFDWRIATAIIGAVAAKEVFVAQMGIVYSLGETEARLGLYEYPDYDFTVTEELTNLDVG